MRKVKLMLIVCSIVMLIGTAWGTGLSKTLIRSYWTNIKGTKVSDLVTNPRYKSKPSGQDEITAGFMAVGWKDGKPQRWGHYFGEKIYGYIVPPENGPYEFALCNDDEAVLYLSNDINPENKIMILRNRVTVYGKWSKPSKKIKLEAGKKYYVELLHKEHEGNTFAKVAWKIPSNNKFELIKAKYLDVGNLKSLTSSKVTSNFKKSRIIQKVLFIGDSITCHSPRKNIGWTGNWGMAASSKNNDFPHQFYKKLCQKQSQVKPSLFIQGRTMKTIRGPGRIDGQLKCLDEYKRIKADLIIIQLGENERPEEVTTENFEKPYEALVSGLKGKHNPIILCTGVWRYKTIAKKCNAMIKRVCKRTGAHYVSIKSVRDKYPATSAKKLFKNAAVGSHPGDLGHLLYAKALWKKFIEILNKDTAIKKKGYNKILGSNFDRAGNNKEFLKSSWRIGSGVLAQNSFNGKTVLPIGNDSWSNIRLSMKIKPGRFNPNIVDHFVGIKARGVYITLRDKHIGCAVDGVGGGERVIIDIPPKNNKFNTLIIDYLYDKIKISFNGKRATISKPPFTKGGFELITWNQKAQIDDIAVFGLPIDKQKSNAFRNLLGNGSFEQQTTSGLPDGWTDGLGWGLQAPKWTSEKGYARYLQSWNLDNSNAYQGKSSMKIKGPLSLISMLRPLHNKRPHILSAYLKGKENNTKVKMLIQGWQRGKFKTLAEKTVIIDKKWKRFSMSIDKLPDSRAYCAIIKAESDGSIVWIDAMQLEEGQKISTFVNNSISYEANSVADSKDLPEKLRRPIVVFLDKSFYTNEKNANIIVAPDKQFELPVSLSGSVCDSSGKLLEKIRTKINSAGNTQINIKLNKLTKEQYTVNLSLQDANGKILKSELLLKKLDPKKNEIKIDHNKRAILVNNMPRMFSGIVFEHVPSTMALRHLKESGYEFVAINFPKADELKRVLGDLADLDMKCIVWQPSSKNGNTDRIEAAVKSYRNHPAVLAWWIYDEPLSANEPFKKMYDYTVKLDAYHPVLINYTYGGIFSRVGNLPGDILLYDDYPIPDRPMQDVWNNSSDAGQIAFAQRKPLWVILQSFGYAYSRPRSPSPEELEFMTYSTILNGATGILFYTGLPRSEKQWEKLKQLNKEIKYLQNIILDANKTEHFGGTSPIKYNIIHHNNKKYVIAVNSSPNVQYGTLKITRPYNESVKVLFENRTVYITNGRIKDKFQAYQRHVYELSNK